MDILYLALLLTLSNAEQLNAIKWYLFIHTSQAEGDGSITPGGTRNLLFMVYKFTPKTYN